MQLVTPSIGLLFWMFITFGVVLFVLKKFAWKPILNALKERDQSIESALQSAELAREEMTQLKADNQKIMIEAKKERDELLMEARNLKDKIITEAKEKAAAEANKILETARQNFRSEKEAAINEIKNQVAVLSVEVAEKILKQKLSEYKEQKELIENMMKDLKMN